MQPFRCVVLIFWGVTVLNYAFLASRLQSDGLQTKLLQHTDIVAFGPNFNDALHVFNMSMETDFLSNPSIPLFSVLKPCSACSRVFARDIYSDHAVSCAVIIGIKHRHNIMRDTLVDICYCSRISARKEVDIGLDRGRDKPLRPADMLLYSWGGGLDVCVDLTGSLPLTQTGMADLCTRSGETNAVILLKRIQKFSMTQDIGARADVHNFNRIGFSIAKGVWWLSHSPCRITISVVVSLFRLQFLSGCHDSSGNRLTKSSLITHLRDRHCNVDAQAITKQSLTTNLVFFEEAEVTFKRIGVWLCRVCFKTHTLRSKCRHGSSNFVPPPDCGDGIVKFVLYDLTKPSFPSSSVPLDHVDVLGQDVHGGFTLTLFDHLLSKGLRTVKSIPPKCRLGFSRVLKGALDKVICTPDDISCWVSLLVLPICLLKTFRPRSNLECKSASKRQHQEECIASGIRSWGTPGGSLQLLRIKLAICNY
ncbi:hypothetical protein Tco_1475901 [Tanacetum coccineum]